MMTSARGPGNGVGRVVQPSLTPIIEVADHSGVHGMRWGGRAEELQRMLDQLARHANSAPDLLVSYWYLAGI